MFPKRVAGLSFSTSSLCGKRLPCAGSLATSISRETQTITMTRKCDLTGKRANNGFKHSFSHIRTRIRQNPNLHRKKIYWEEGQRLVILKVSAKALRTIEKVGLTKMAKEAGIDLWKLPFTDVRPERLEYMKEHHHEVPMPKPGPYAIKNPEKIAKSRKKPLKGVYIDGGRIMWTRDY